jgi:hypothetical protein
MHYWFFAACCFYKTCIRRSRALIPN